MPPVRVTVKVIRLVPALPSVDGDVVDRDERRRAVVVDDRAGRGAVGDAAAGRVGQRDGEALVALGVEVAVDVEGDRLRGLAGGEADLAGERLAGGEIAGLGVERPAAERHGPIGGDGAGAVAGAGDGEADGVVPALPSKTAVSAIDRLGALTAL